MPEPAKRQSIRVLLADDHAIVRQGFRLILSQHADLSVVGEASNGEEAIAKTAELTPDVVIIDLDMPGINGVEATRHICRNHPHVRVLVLTMHKDAIYVRESLRAGATGYLLKESIDVDLVSAVRTLARGEGFLSPAVSNTVLEDYRRQVTDPLDLITNRERQILQMLGAGKSSKVIAQELKISVYTVDAHRSRLMKKLQLHSIGDLVRFAIQKGLA